MHDTPYKLKVFPKMRMLISEYLRRSRIKNNINLFVEADVTNLMRFKQEQKELGLDFSLPIYILYCFARLLQNHPDLISMRKGNKLFQFENADILTVVEREGENGTKVPMAIIIRNAGAKSYLEIHNEIRNSQEEQPENILEVKKRRRLLNFPSWLIRLSIARAQSHPVRYCKHYGNAAFTSPLRGGNARFSIAVPISSCTLTLLLNSTFKKVISVNGSFVESTFMGFTFVVDHDIIDGARGMRIVDEFCKMVEAFPVLDK